MQANANNTRSASCPSGVGKGGADEGAGNGGALHVPSAGFGVALIGELTARESEPPLRLSRFWSRPFDRLALPRSAGFAGDCLPVTYKGLPAIAIFLSCWKGHQCCLW